MKLLWFAALANMASVSFGLDLLEASAKACTCAADCPQLTCQTNTCSPSGFCQYTAKPVGSKCPGQSCTNGGVCDDDANDSCNDKAECISAYKPSTTLCRSACNECDVPEYCTGASGSCPVDAYAPPTMACTGNNNGAPCDGQDLCDGFGHCVDKYLPSTTVCRASKGQCDVAETCTGTGGGCPIDVFQSTTTTCTGTNNGGACDGTDKCDGKGNCVDNYLPSTTVCRASAGQCDVVESCTGSSSACPADAFASESVKCSGSSTGGACDVQDYCDGKGACADKYQSSSYVCRASKGVCDVAETCTGSSGSCPADGYAPSTKTCSGSCNDGPCDGEDKCDGKGNCVDVFLPSTTVCRKSAGQCDVAETCTGSSGSCPADAFQPITMTCSGSNNGGACDGQDYCDGKGGCVDKYLPSSTVCRKSAGQCDVAETCTGSASACPADAFQPTTMTCSGSNNGGACDGQDYCDGKGACTDMYLSSSTVCRKSAGQCDVAETCTGSSSACPADAFQPTTMGCTGNNNGGACDGADKCDGKGGCTDMYLGSTAQCRASKGQCDVAEFCSGSASACPTDTFASSYTSCTGTSNNNPCDGQDLCDGKGNCVDAYLSSSTVCRKSGGQCDVAETCTGSSGLCPADAFQPTTMTCSGTSSGGACDGTDKCDGKGNCVDVFSPSSTICRAAANACDVAEYCSGTAGSCPANSYAASTVSCKGTCNGNPCDGDDKCDGKGNCVDNYLPSGTVCGNTKAGPCTIAAVCDGTMGFCPPDEFADSSVTCTGKSSGGVCDGTDKCDGNGNCVDKFLGGKVVCQKPVGYARPIYCNGKQATCPTAYSFLDATHLREALEIETPEQLLALRASSPVLVVGLVCAVAAAVAMVTLRTRRESTSDMYLALDTPDMY